MEYQPVAHVVAEIAWLRHLMQELLQPIAKSTVVYCDNVFVVYMSRGGAQWAYPEAQEYGSNSFLLILMS